MEMYFTKDGRSYANKIVELAAAVPEERRKDFIIFLEGASSALQLQGIKEVKSPSSLEEMACSMDIKEQ